MNRRHFLKHLLSGSSALAVGGVAQLGMIRNALANQGTQFNDYKALVCVMLLGGNDGVNMFVPLGTGNRYQYDAYATAREDLAVADNKLAINDFYTGQSLSNNPYSVTSDLDAYRRAVLTSSQLGSDIGINSVMPEIAKMVEDSQMTLVANSGNLITPLTVEEYKSKSAAKPPFLFAHNHQQRAMFTGWGDNLKAQGWAGRLADNWLNAGVNQSSPLGMNISYSGTSRLLNGNHSKSLVLPTGSMPSHWGLDVGNQRRSVLDQLLLSSREDYFMKLAQNQISNSITNLENLRSLWDNAGDPFNTATDSYGGALFSTPGGGEAEIAFNTGLMRQLEAVAKMIHIGHSNPQLNTQRQIFYVTLGGFDTHASQVTKHPALLRGLSLAMDKFNRAMQHLNLGNQVTTFTMSDFGRTVRTNGDGTDHAWGSHSMVMGGAASGGLVGQLPDIALGGADDVSGKGRLLPSLAQDQVNATLARWFGVEDELIKELFPNIENFTTNNDFNSAFVTL